MPVEVPVIKIEQHTDTIIERHERIVEVKGDSVFVTQKDIIKEVSKVAIHDTVPKIVYEQSPPEIQEVEKPLSWWTQTLIRIGWLALIGGLLFAAYKLIRWRLKRNK